MVRSICLITCILFLSGRLSAMMFEVEPPDTVPPNLRVLVVPNDTLSFEDEDFEQVEDISECLIRNCDIYSVWDTLRINPYGMDLRQKKDTTVLKLISDELCDYSHPACGIVTSDFGYRRNRFHYGIDIDLETGDAVLAAFEGTVRIARYSPSYGYCVIIRHPNGLETLYAHLSSLHVASGQYLQAGDVLGLGGNTGRSRGSHLHFEVRFLGQQINPRDLISFEEYSCLNPELEIHANRFDYLTRLAVHKAGAKGAAKYYKIKKGDSLAKIAKQNHTTVAKLCALNKMSKKSVLKVGARIRVV